MKVKPIRIDPSILELSPQSKINHTQLITEQYQTPHFNPETLQHQEQNPPYPKKKKKKKLMRSLILNKNIQTNKNNVTSKDQKTIKPKLKIDPIR